MPSNASTSVPTVPTTNNANEQSVNTITGEVYKFSVWGDGNSRANMPGYFYRFFESPRSLQFGGYTGGGTNGLEFGQRNANPASAFRGETNGSNSVVQVERVGAAVIPESVVARQLAGVNARPMKKPKPRYIKEFFA